MLPHFRALETPPSKVVALGAKDQRSASIRPVMTAVKSEPLSQIHKRENVSTEASTISCEPERDTPETLTDPSVAVVQIVNDERTSNSIVTVEIEDAASPGK